MIVFSVLDRLMTDPRRNVVEEPNSRGRNARQSDLIVTQAEFEQYRACVRRDLEWLLNTRRITIPLRESLRELEGSVYCYGLPDFSQLNLYPGRSEGDRDRLAGLIARTIELFEPRILKVQVTLDQRSLSSQNLRFQVSGKLKMKPRPEQVSYDATLDVTRGEYAVVLPGEERA